MIESLKQLYNELVDISTYLLKIVKDRRKTSETAQLKLAQATKLHLSLSGILKLVNSKIEKSEICTQDIISINKLTENINIIYNKITSLMTFETSTTKMEFDIKTGISLLPVLNGQEQIAQQLIDGILMYSGMLSDGGNKLLIEFVLKTRLNPSAKLRLSQSYQNEDELVLSMRKHLLPKKSAVALQSKLLQTTQGRRSIENFGSELEKLFVDLTLAQSDGDQTKFSILRLINEKIAIKRFSDGLDNQRLSTIIAARQFESLPEAIRTALDEQTMSPSEDHVFEVRRFQKNSYNPFRGSYNNHGRFSANHGYRNPQTSTPFYKNRASDRGHWHRGRGFESRGGARDARQWWRGGGGSGQPAAAATCRPRINYVEEQSPETGDEQLVNINSGNAGEFFRQ